MPPGVANFDGGEHKQRDAQMHQYLIYLLKHIDHQQSKE